MAHNKEKIDVSEVPSAKELEEWKSIAVKMGLSYKQFTTRAIRRFVADYELHVQSSLTDFLDDKAPNSKQMTITEETLSEWLMEKATFAAGRFNYYLVEIETLMEEGIILEEEIKQLVQDGVDSLDLLEKGVPDLLSFSICIIELHEVAASLESYLFGDETEDDEYTSEIKANLEQLLRLDIDKNTKDT